jgi:predicted metalloprotease with PDZ domain
LISSRGDSKGQISDVLWDSPAFKAGIGAGMKLIAVNGHDFGANDDVLKNAIQEAKTSKAPIALLVRNQDTYTTYQVDYHDGLKYPQLQAIPGAAPVLDTIITPLK